MVLDLNPWFLITLIGAPELWLGIAGGLVVFYLIFKKSGKSPVKGFIMVFVLSLLIVFGLVIAVKSVTMVPRPCGSENPYCDTDSSFPSGHSAAIFVFFTVLVLFAGKKVLPLAIIPILVASSRVALGVHTIADVVAGGALGIVVTIIIWEILRSKRKI